MCVCASFGEGGGVELDKFEILEFGAGSRGHCYSVTCCDRGICCVFVNLAGAPCCQHNCVSENSVESVVASDDFGAVYGAATADEIVCKSVFEYFDIRVFADAFDED